MEPLPETTEAVEEFGPFSEGDLLHELRARSEQVRRIVPDCVGLSLASLRAGVTFTLVATAEEIALLDGIQYADGGPCVAAVAADRVLACDEPSELEEEGWHLFARATAAAGVASTLTLPIVEGDRVTGSVNLYAATPRAFVGHHEQVARIFDAWAPGAVANADLDFTTRAHAEEAPARLAREYDVLVATGLLAEQMGLDPDSAREELTHAAGRAGVTELQLARGLIALRHADG